MRVEKLILGLLLLPLIIAIFVILFPLILIFGLLALILRSRASRPFFRSQTIRTQSSKPKTDDDIIDVEVIKSENIGD